MYVEFFGPPGSGKSTIYSKLVGQNNYYGDPDGQTIHRLHTKKDLFKYNRFYQTIPRRFRNRLKSAIEWQFRHSMFVKFVTENPQFPHLLMEILYRTDHEIVNSLSKLKGTAEQYQIAHDTAKDDEIIVMDEGFAQKALAILMRIDNRDFPINKFFEFTPNPEIIFYIDAPIEVCIERQQSRGKYLYQNKEWAKKDQRSFQEDISEICSTITTLANSYTTVIYIKNAHDIDSAVDSIDMHIKEYYKNINCEFEL